jgi:SSS family solute:Na+ symporter
MAFPKLGEFVLPTALRGLFFVGLLATIMSTLDSTSFLSAITFGRDLVWRIRKKGNINKYTQIGIVISILFSAFVIYFIPSVVNIWYTLGTLFIPALIFPLISIFLPFSIGKMTKNDALICIISSFIATFMWFAIGIYKNGIENPAFPLNIQPFFIGLSIASFIFIIDILRKSTSHHHINHKVSK